MRAWLTVASISLMGIKLRLQVSDISLVLKNCGNTGPWCENRTKGLYRGGWFGDTTPFQKLQLVVSTLETGHEDIRRQPYSLGERDFCMNLNNAN
mmetsp:Transcript_1794/g.3277  ORF Transcript_1794/g.3277 Transcript_1794/m.3277 type:complete len:95 (-) Transcript_1794:1219-1503(-)